MSQGRKLRFSQSQSKHRLFVGNIPKAWEKEELEKVLGEQGPGIQSVELLKVRCWTYIRFICSFYVSTAVALIFNFLLMLSGCNMYLACIDMSEPSCLLCRFLL